MWALKTHMEPVGPQLLLDKSHNLFFFQSKYILVHTSGIYRGFQMENTSIDCTILRV